MLKMTVKSETCPNEALLIQYSILFVTVLPNNESHQVVGVTCCEIVSMDGVAAP